MINLHKIIKVFVLMLVIFSFFAVLIYSTYPEIYLSYATGYSIKTISEFYIIENSYLPIDISRDKLCSLPDPKPILEAYIRLENFSLLMIKIAFAVSFIFVLTTKEILSKKYSYGILSILSFALIMYTLAYLGDARSLYTGCD